LLAALAAAAAVPSMAEVRQPLPVLGRLQPGLWHLRDLDGGASPPAPVCLGDPALLVQLRHRGRDCSKGPVSSAPDSVTITYNCPAAGLGHTTIRVETPRLARIESQGIDNGIPFAFRAEARRVGPCPVNGGRPAR
jgi:hypothetical protein